MSSLELSEEYGLRQKTCWEFKWKIQQAMQSSKNTSIYRRSTYREFYVGEEEEGVVEQKAGKKKLIVVALEMQGVEFGKAYAQVIDDVSFLSLSNRPLKPTLTRILLLLPMNGMDTNHKK